MNLLGKFDFYWYISYKYVSYWQKQSWLAANTWLSNLILFELILQRCVRIAILICQKNENGIDASFDLLDQSHW